MSGSAAPILVTGATGRHGSTGAHVARRLCEEGRPVRILARTLSERTDALAALGADVVVEFTELSRLIARRPVSLREFVRANRAELEVSR